MDALVPERIASVIQILIDFDRFDEDRFLRLLDGMILRTSALTASDAAAIGRLILERAWVQAASDMVGQYKAGRLDVRPTLRACYDLLSPWDRFILGLTPIPASEKWKILESVAANLYPGGPDDYELWERAGGNNADLASGGDGRTRWGKAIRSMWGGKQPAPYALLRIMRDDYPNNEQVSHLSTDPVFRGIRRATPQSDETKQAKDHPI